MNDTQATIEQRYKELLLSKTPLERLKMASRMYDSGRKLVISGILRRSPSLDTSRLRVQLFLRMYEDDFTAPQREKIIKKITNVQLDTES